MQVVNKVPVRLNIFKKIIKLELKTWNNVNGHKNLFKTYSVIR